MTNTSPPPAADPGEQQGPRTTRNEVLELGRLRRASDDRHIAGVAGGLARHLDIDPIIVRVALVVLVFFGGSGLLLYGAMWLLVPEEGSPAEPLGLDDRNRNIALIGTGVLAAIAAVGDFAGAFWFPRPLVIIGLLVVWFLNRKEKSDQQPATYASAQPQPGWQMPTTAETTGTEQAYSYPGPALPVAGLREAPQPAPEGPDPLLVHPRADRHRRRHARPDRCLRHLRSGRRLPRPRHVADRGDAAPRRLLGPCRRTDLHRPHHRRCDARRNGDRELRRQEPHLHPDHVGRGPRLL
ncbi:PspC domain-containing protein [Nocardioides sp. B-3]|uniref:PspC domain-containing protein n=1 Tax=Nocardioides sp. B-3 TaxID=2895565 RepID=UPI0021532528|nr:PspC domain-containing protein [Nocardioides sp. B-3]UUZ57977.1 PspC domain-containing protein [Nocardioides sp. B-3]